LIREGEARWLIQNRLTPRIQVPNYLDYLHPETLLLAGPEAVGLIIPGKVNPK